MTAGTHNITIEQGTDWQLVLTYKLNGVAVNLTGYTARMQVRHIAASPTVLATFSTPPSSSTSSGSLTPAAGTIALGGSAGTITLAMPASESTRVQAGSHVYDLELINPSGKVERFLQGNCEVTAEVTR